jgi:predicted nucleotidyltransferase
MAKNEVIEILKLYVNLLRAEGVCVDKAFLYGSYLNDSASSDSDIDLMVVTDDENDDYLAGKIWKLTRNVNSKIEPFIVSKNRFYGKDNSPLLELVRRTGLEIV